MLIEERTQILLHVITSADHPAIESIHQQIRTSLMETTTLDIRPSAGNLEQCSGAEVLSCWSERTIGDRTTPYLLVLTINRLPDGRDHVALLLLDIDRARSAIEHTDRSLEDWQREQEDLIFQDAVHDISRTISLENEPDVQALLSDFFKKIEPLLVAARHWRPNGSLEIHVDRADLLLALDGVPIGRTQASTTVVEGIFAGQHQLTVVDDNDLVRFDQLRVDITRGERSTVTPIPREGENSAPLVREVTLWSGVGLATVGATLVVVALAKRPELHVACPGGVCPEQDSAFVSFSELSDPESGGSGLLVAPLGYSLMITGATWSVGSLTIGEYWEMPWLSLGLGLALGAASYSISHLAN